MSIDVNARWSTYEANVQAYRSNMIASQSFLLAVGAILLDKSSILLLICVIVAIIQLWYIWFRLIRVRTIISDYYKFNLMNRFDENGDEAPNCEQCLQEETYTKNRIIRKKVNDQLAKTNPKLKHNMRLTRIKIDLILPISFSVIWLSFFISIFLP